MLSNRFFNAYYFFFWFGFYRPSARVEVYA